MHSGDVQLSLNNTAVVSQRALQPSQGFRPTWKLMSKRAEVNVCDYWEPKLQAVQISVSSLIATSRGTRTVISIAAGRTFN